MVALAKLPAFAAGIRHLRHADAQGLSSPPRFKSQLSTKPSSKPLVSLILLPQSIPSPRNPRVSSLASSSEGCSDGDLEHDAEAAEQLHPVPLPSNGLLRRAGFIGAATVASKILGLLREIVLAAVIGVGPVATAFNHAAMLPRFSTSFLGGVNGPIHVTVATTLSKLSKENRRRLIWKMHTIMFLIGGVLAALTYIFAESIIYVSAPGLQVLAEGELIREMAFTQLKVMTPCILFAGSVGLGFGFLTAEGNDTVPCLSPSMTSIIIIVSCAIYILMNGSRTFAMNPGLSGVFISFGVSLGALLQWVIQVHIHVKIGYDSNSISWKDFLIDKDVHKLFSLILPATFSSGLVQIATLTDLYFSSFIPGAAAGLSYAHLLAMAPSGILSSTIVLPMLPIFSRHAKPSSWESLKKNLQKAILLGMVIILPITSTLCVLAGPIISVLFQRFIFNSAASSFVSPLLLCYSIGSPFWIIRELFAAVFYSLGDGNWPFLVNVIAILLNGILDWLSISVFDLGAQGLALSTSFVTALSVFALLHLLSKKLRGKIHYRKLIGPLLLLLACCIISGFTTFVSYSMLRYSLSSISILRFCRLAELLSILLAGFLGISSFYFPLVFLPLPGVTCVNELFITSINI